MDRRLAVVLGILGAGCKPTTPSAAPSIVAEGHAEAAPSAAPVASAPGAMAQPSGSAWVEVAGTSRPSAEQVAEAWKPLMVTAQTSTLRALYTWTKPEQAEQLRRGGKLLIKGSDDAAGMSRFELQLWNSYNSDPWSRVFLNPPFHRGRYAWPHPWATRLGGDREPYGDVLVQIKLRPEAIIAVFNPQGARRWTFHTMSGEVLGDAQALKRAGQVAAVVHTSEQVISWQIFREVVVCNEAMVESWSLGTDEIAAKLASDVAAIDLLARWARGRRGWGDSLSQDELYRWLEVVRRGWGEPTSTIEGLYLSSLAFASERYQPTEGALQALLQSMRAVPAQGAPFTGRGGAAAHGAITIPAALPIRPAAPCVPRGTFGCFERASYPCRGVDGRIIPCAR